MYMNMFTNYDYVPEDYVPNNMLSKNIIHKPTVIPHEVRNTKNEIIGFGWNYNDDIMLEFFTDGTVEYDSGESVTADTYLQGKKFKLTIFNFRFEVLHEEILDASADLKYFIPSNLKNVLLPNTYSIQIDLMDESGNISYTMINRRDFKIFVR